MNENIIFNKRFEEQLKLSGKSSNQIERELGYPRNALSNYKKGGIPSGSRLLELADYFNVSPEYLIGYTHEKQESIEATFSQLSFSQKKTMYLLCQKWIMQLICEKK